LTLRRDGQPASRVRSDRAMRRRAALVSTTQTRRTIANHTLASFFIYILMTDDKLYVRICAMMHKPFHSHVEIMCDHRNDNKSVFCLLRRLST